MKTINPLVTIYMPVFNAIPYLSQAIESILNQSYSNFEFIIVDDASTDNSWKVIKSYAKKDSRIIAIKNHINLGVSLTSNIAISKAKGKFLARMDADDISFTDRIEKQVDFLIKNPKTIAVGGQCVVIDENNNIIGNKKFPTQHQKLKDMIFWAVPMQQPSTMINLDKLPQNFVWYSPNQSSAEEINLMFRFMIYGQISNTEDNLLFYRHLNNSLSHKNPKATFKLTIKSRFDALSLGFKPNFKAIILNIMQLIIIALIPSNLIYDIWYLIRGIKKPTGATVGTFAETQV
ncbi:MAG: glycosyltransferase family 2 protein [Candidatus Shapirobacteria bacterium]|nr:glycosyltransferase family 2 protein [Candidatus Shapirobacteria bacterium]